MIAWRPTSLSCSSSAGTGRMLLCPTTPRKSPMTLMSGLSAFAALDAPPYTGNWAAATPGTLTGTWATCGAVAAGGAAAPGAGAAAAQQVAFRAWSSASSARTRSSSVFKRSAFVSAGAACCAPNTPGSKNRMPARTGAFLIANLLQKILRVPKTEEWRGQFTLRAGRGGRWLRSGDTSRSSAAARLPGAGPSGPLQGSERRRQLPSHPKRRPGRRGRRGVRRLLPPTRAPARRSGTPESLLPGRELRAAAWGYLIRPSLSAEGLLRQEQRVTGSELVSWKGVSRAQS